jgi:hypothetical protein
MFKAMITSVSVKEDYDSGKRDLSFEAVLMWEPRLKQISYIKPNLLLAKDNIAKSYSPKATVSKNAYWQQSYRPFVSFGGTWDPIKIEGISQKTISITDFSFEIPVRVVNKMGEGRFLKILSAKKPFTQKMGNLSVTISSLEIKKNTCKASVKIKGNLLGGMSSYSFCLEKDGEKIGWMMSGMGTGGSSEITKELTFKTKDQNLKGDFDLLFNYPSKTMNTKLKFSFKNLELPKIP